MSRAKESWSSRTGVILAVAGSAVGLGNFLRFPGQAAQYGGGAFMIAYFISLLIIGIPVGWAEWSIGRYGGRFGYRSSPGIFHVLLGSTWGRYLGVIGLVIPVMIYMYYVYIEAWCLGYAVNAARGALSEPGTNFSAFFARYTGAAEDGVSLRFGTDDVGIFVVAVYFLNLLFIYRGLSKGIETVCKYAMPALILIALVILGRVLTLGTPDPSKPDQNLLNGLGFMWNPQDVAEGLTNPQLWLAAAGQIFFSLSVGFGVIVTYSSYLTDQDDVVLSSLTASATNEFCEVGLGGLITVPAAFMFLGAAGIVGQGTFGLGFNVLPEVFARMPAGGFFATAFFTLLFLAAVTSSLSMLQPGIAFLEEALNLSRKSSVTFLGLVTAIGTLFVWYFSKDLKALDTIDFWVGTLLIFIQATILIIAFGWKIGIDKGWEELHLGADLRAPDFFKPVTKYITPLFLLTIFVLFLLKNVVGWNFVVGPGALFTPTSYVRDLIGPEPNDVARLSVGLIALVFTLALLLAHRAGKNWERKAPAASKENNL
jgi:NSS family neurotransmitter:Na+ symporter